MYVHVLKGLSYVPFVLCNNTNGGYSHMYSPNVEVDSCLDSASESDQHKCKHINPSYMYMYM